jgi:intracellular sulfur oxidation DsrE/DsrF family protein
MQLLLFKKALRNIRNHLDVSPTTTIVMVTQQTQQGFAYIKP